jgi:hypothetical protein
MRLASNDFRYEAFHILKTIGSRLVQAENNISQTSLYLLCASLTDLTENLPHPMSIKEKLFKEESLQIISELATFTATHITTGLILNNNKTIKLLNIGVAMIQRGLKKEGREIIQRFIALSSADKFEKSGIYLLYLLSCLLPGSVAVYIWRNIGLVYRIFFKRL